MGSPARSVGRSDGGDLHGRLGMGAEEPNILVGYRCAAREGTIGTEGKAALSAQPWYTAICDVCRLVDRDVSYKMCFYCSLCDSNICERDADLKNPIVLGRRTIAKVLRSLEKRGLFA
jgi:hypothetical protein